MSITKIKSVTDIKLSHGIYFLSIAFISSVVLSLQNIQSSLNIQAGLGVASLSVWTGAQAAGIFLLNPLLFSRIKPKKAFLISDVGGIFYILANLYPNFYTMIPTAFVSGIARSIYWLLGSVYTVEYVKLYVHFGKNFKKSLAQTNAIFAGAYFSGSIFGNLLPFLILKSDTFDDNLVNGTDDYTQLFTPKQLVLSSSLNTTTNFNEFRGYSLKDICGANDCQNPAIVSSEASNNKPPTKETVYSLMGLMIGLYIVAIVLHVVFLLDFEESNDSKSINTVLHKSICVDKSSSIATIRKQTEAIKEYNTEIMLDSSRTKDNASSLTTEKTTKNYSYMNQLKETVMFLIHPHQLLLTAPGFYSGVTLAFSASEITRAYVSCVFGINQVGIMMSLYGVVTFLTVIIVGKLSAKLGRMVWMLLGGIANSSVFLFCLLWMPDETSSLSMAYILLFLCAITDAIMFTITTEAEIAHFPDQSKIAFSAWTVSCCLGLSFQFSWSTFVCVRTKIYILWAILIFSIITFCVAEQRNSRRQRKKVQKVTINENDLN